LENLDEEDYLEKLLKSMDHNTEEVDEEPNSESKEPIIDSNENSQSDVLEELAVSEESDNSSMEIANEIGQADIGVISDEKETPNELGEEYKALFEPEDNGFKISDIPDREPAELTQIEMERLADMNSDKIIEDEDNESVSVEQSFEKKENILDENILNENNIDENNIDENNLSENNLSENNLKENDSIDINLIENAVVPTLDNGSFEAEAIISAAKAITNDIIAPAQDIITKEKKTKEKKTKEKKIKEKKTKKKSDEKKNGKKRSLLKSIKNIFLEDIEQNEPVEPVEPAEPLKQAEQVNPLEQDLAEHLDEPKDENQRVLDELYGDNAQEEFINDNDYQGDNDYKGGDDSKSNIENAEPIKKGFFAKRKAKAAAKKAELAEIAKAEEEAEELELNQKKSAKEEKKLIQKDKKNEAKAKKEESKKPKAEKVIKPKKQKKPKEPIRPQDKLKIKPISLIFLLTFVIGMVVLIEIGNTAFHYTNDVSQAQLYFQNGNYQLAYNSLQGVDLKPTDEELYDQINTIMFVQKQYTSYQNYLKLGMGVEALDSLIKGVQRYYTYYPTAKELGVSDQLDENKVLIISALKSTFSMSEEKAISYASLSDSDFTQYYMTLESYGGMVSK